jgi:transcriptional regulator with XRE-family HTH domain
MNCKLTEETVGQRIKAQRVRMNMTQDKLAEIMLIPKSTISAYENDKVDIKGSVIVELSKYLHTSPNYLLGFELAEEKDSILETICFIYNRIEDDRVKALLLLQIQAAEKVMR